MQCDVYGSASLRVFAFVEYYPSPFKPYLDTQFGQTVADGHDLSIFAFGTWGNPGSRVIAEFGLDRRTHYLPASPRHVARYARAALVRAMPRMRRVARVLATSGATVRRRLVNATQAALLPLQAPDLCMVHDLGTIVCLPAMRSIHPHARIALYYHGGEVAAGVVPDAAAARAGFDLADCVFVNSRFAREQVLARGCAPDRVHIVPIGFDLSQFPFADTRPRGADRPWRLVVVGRLARDKGIEHAIDAVADLVAGGFPVECTIIGDGDRREALEARTRLAGLGEWVRFAGTLPHQQVIVALSTADAVILPSVPTGNWVETQGCVLQEAMLVGTMVVASRIGGVPEAVPEEMGPFLVPPGDAVAIARAVRQLAAMEVDEWTARAHVNRRFCEGRYDIRALNRQMLTAAMGPRETPAA